jgi:DNA repair exonuclease SbcCD ATPase subunit
MQQELVLLIAVCTGVVISLVTLVMAASAMREGRRASEMLRGRLSQAEHDLKRARWAEIDAQNQAQKLKEQLAEQRPEKLIGKLEHATGQLEQLQLRLSDTERLVGEQKQHLSEQSERQKREHQRLEQENENLMEEVERWRERYVGCQQRVEHLKQEYSEAQQRVEQLTKLRERLRAEMDDTVTTDNDAF